MEGLEARVPLSSLGRVFRGPGLSLVEPRCKGRKTRKWEKRR